MNLLSDIKHKVLEIIKTHQNISIDKITSLSGLSKTSIRRHLISLERKKLIERNYIPSARGRPILSFKLTRNAYVLFPSQNAELLNQLLQYLIERNQHELLKDFFEKYWNSRLLKFSETLKSKKRDDQNTRLEVIKSLLEEEGFNPHIRKDRVSGQLHLQERHCPFESVVQVTRLPCKLEQNFISKALKINVNTVSLRPSGDENCDFELPKPNKK